MKSIWHATPRSLGSKRLGRAGALLVSALFVCALLGGAASRSAFAQDSQGIDADALRDFETQLVEAFTAGDVAAIVAMSAPEVRYSDWEGSRRVLDAQSMGDLIAQTMLTEDSAPTYQDAVGLNEIEAIVGEDPLTLWGEDLPIVSVLLVGGLTDTLAGETLLGIAPDETGAPLLAGVLFAEDGLPAAPAPVDEATPSDSSTSADDTTSADDATPEPSAESSAESIDTNDTEVAAQSTPEPALLPETTPQPESARIDIGVPPAVYSVTGNAAADVPVNFVVGAQAGQALTIDLSSTSEAASFSVTGARNGQPYKTLENPARVWTLTVPATQDYQIEVLANEPADFVLSLLLSPVGHRLPTPTAVDATEVATEESGAEVSAEVSAEANVDATANATPEIAEATSQKANTSERVRIGPGQSNTERSGAIVQGERHDYILRIVGGQTLIVSISSDGDLANFAITGIDDGQPYKRLENEDRYFAQELPTTQDYLISVATASQSPVNYTLSIEVPPLAASPTPEVYPTIEAVSNPTRIQLAAGATSTTINDLLGAYGADGYLLEAQAGQTMYVTLASPDSIAQFSVSDWETGEVLKPLNGEQDWQATLPTSGDFLVQVENPRGVRVQYHLEVGFSALSEASTPVSTPMPPEPTPEPTPVPAPPAQRITFPPGAISASVDGFIRPNELQAYVLEALEGQNMTVVISSNAGDVGLSIVGADGTPYKRASEGGSGFAFELPKNQDYYITAVGGSTATAYNLSIIIVN